MKSPDASDLARTFVTIADALQPLIGHEDEVAPPTEGFDNFTP